MASELKIGDYVIWDGVTDRIIGTLATWPTAPGFDHCDVRLLHGGLCTARKDVLRPCDTDTVLLALARGGTTLPKD